MAQAAPTPMGAPTDPTQGDMSQGGDQGQTPDLSNGYEICIKVSADQQISVSVEPADPDDQGGDDEDSQSVPSIKAACQVAQDIFRNAGQMSDGGAEQDAMAGGYGGAQ